MDGGPLPWFVWGFLIFWLKIKNREYTIKKNIYIEARKIIYKIGKQGSYRLILDRYIYSNN